MLLHESVVYVLLSAKFDFFLHDARIILNAKVIDQNNMHVVKFLCMIRGMMFSEFAQNIKACVSRRKIMTLMAVNSDTMIDRADKRRKKTCGYLRQKNAAVHTANYSTAGLKVKQSHYRPGVAQKLSFPDFVTKAQDGGRFSALRTGRLYPQEIRLVLISVRG